MNHKTISLTYTVVYSITLCSLVCVSLNQLNQYNKFFFRKNVNMPIFFISLIVHIY